MAMIDHWHPTIPSRALRCKPVGVRIAGRAIALFRTSTGETGALDDVCPHRRMRLSLGTVLNDRLQCRYHGWTFDTCGQGESPGTPKLHTCAESYDVREQYGLIWVKPRGVAAPFPQLDIAGYFPICVLQHQAQAPLETTLDNFCEIEHTPTTHAVFGYDLQRMHEVRVCFEPTETTVRVINVGPPKRFGWILRTLVGIGKDWTFNDDWTTYFSPVYSVYDHWWSDPKTGRESKVRWRIAVFFTPIDEHSTALTTLVYAKSTWPGPAGGLRLFRWLLRRNIDHEIDLDVGILNNLADPRPTIEGMKLSRFDRVLGLNRERIDRLYRQRESTSALPPDATKDCVPRT